MTKNARKKLFYYTASTNIPYEPANIFLEIYPIEIKGYTYCTTVHSGKNLAIL